MKTAPVVLITGASSGFGKATAKRLASAGFRTYGTSRKPCSDQGLPWSMIQMDVRNPDAVKKAVSGVVEKEGRINILINNAGIATCAPLEEIGMGELEAVMDTNFKGPLRMCRAVLPGMRQQQSGLIINLSSIAGLISLPFMGAYSASKFALEGFTEALSMEVRPFGITVCLVEPGDFNTEIIQNQKMPEPSPASPYRKALETMKAASDRKMAAAPGPGPVAEKILRIMNSERPGLRYRVGSSLERVSVPAKSLLPSRRFERMVLRAYGLDKI